MKGRDVESLQFGSRVGDTSFPPRVSLSRPGTGWGFRFQERHQVVTGGARDTGTNYRFEGYGREEVMGVLILGEK